MRKVFIIALAAAALLSCQRKDVLDGVKSRNAVQFTVSSGDFSFTTKATESALENNDKVRIVAGAPINASSVATVNGTALTLDTPIYWNADQQQSTTFVGIYQKGEPLSAVTSLTYDLLDGGTHAYEYHNLFMAATRTVAPEQTVSLEFKHPFSKMTVSITNNLVDDAVSKVEIKEIVMKATVDIAEESLVLDSQKKSFEAYKLGDNSYAAIVMPQTAKPSIVVTTASGKVFNFVLSADFTFVAGKAYSAALTLTPGETPPDHGAEVAFSFTVVGWADGGALDYTLGEAEAPAWGIVGTVNNSDWSEDFPMTQTHAGNEAWEGTWEADINYKAGDKFKLRWNKDWEKEAGMNGEKDANEQYVVSSIGLGTSDLWGSGNQDIVLDVEDGSYHLVFVYDGYKLTVTKNAE